jgi:hypothetical protein
VLSYHRRSQAPRHEFFPVDATYALVDLFLHAHVFGDPAGDHRVLLLGKP